MATSPGLAGTEAAFSRATAHSFNGFIVGARSSAPKQQHRYGDLQKDVSSIEPGFRVLRNAARAFFACKSGGSDSFQWLESSFASASTERYQYPERPHTHSGRIPVRMDLFERTL